MGKLAIPMAMFHGYVSYCHRVCAEWRIGLKDKCVLVENVNVYQIPIVWSSTTCKTTISILLKIWYPQKRSPQSGNLIKGTQNHLQRQTVMTSYEIPLSSSIFIPAKVQEIALRSLNQINSHQIPIKFPLFPCDNVQGFAGVRRTAQSTARGAKKKGGTPGAPHGKHAILTAENDGKTIMIIML